MPSGTKRGRKQPGIHPSLIPAIAEELRLCRDDFSRFNETILGRDPYWHRQEEICDSVARYVTTAAPTGNGVGKSYVGAGIGAAFFTTRPGCRVIVAAPTNAQLAGVLWAELERCRSTAAKNGLPLGGRPDGLTIDCGDGWSIEGFGQGSVESKSGRHAGELLAIVDEASGTKASVLEAIDSLNPSRRLYLGNPLRPEGKFYELCENSAGNPHVNVIRIPSTESPDIGLERSHRGMADATWLELCRHEYGEESLWWLSHVLARFPGETFEHLLPASWLELAAQTIHSARGNVRLGVDIAKGTERDESMIVARDDAGVIDRWGSNRWSIEQLADQVAEKTEALSVEPGRITFDETGIGTDFGNRLRAKGLHGAKGFMGSRPGGEKFFNLRSASAWALRRRLDPARSAVSPAEAGRLLYAPQAPFSIPRHLVQAYRPELGVRYRLDDAGRIQLEVKEELVARLRSSPNFLDALIMTFAYPHA